MADIIFTDVTVLGYNIENYFLGDGTARYGSTKRLTIEVMSYNINVGGSTTGELNTSFNNDGVSETWDNFKTHLNNVNNTGDFQNIKIRGPKVTPSQTDAQRDWDLGAGIVESVGTTEQNPIRVGYHRFSIEIPYSSTDALPNAGSYIGIKDAFTLGSDDSARLIRDFSESFNFSEDEDGDYTHEHSVSIRFEEGGNTTADYEIAKGKAFADELFKADKAPPFGFVVRPGLYSDAEVKDRRHYYTETYDAFTKTCSFVKKLTIKDEDAGDYTKKVRHTTNLGMDGIVSVTEYCEIKGKDDYAQALVGMESELHTTNSSSANNNTGTARTRCIAVFNSNAKFLGDGGKYNGSDSAVETAGPPPADTSPADLKTGTTGLSRLNQAISISKQFNKRKKSVNYTITFNNDPTIEDNYIHEYSMNYTENQNGSVNVSQNGRIRPYGQKTVDKFNSIKTYFTNVKSTFTTKAANYYTELMDGSGPTSGALKPTATSVSFSGGVTGMEISYSKSHSDDLSLRYSYNISSESSSTPQAQSVPSTIKRLNLSISDTAPQLIRSTYAIPNKSDNYQLLHEPIDGLGKQTNMGSRTVEIRALKARIDNENVYSSFPSLTTELNYLKQLALIKVAGVLSDLKLGKVDLFLDSCSYSFNNNRELSFRLSAKYVTKSEVEYTSIHATTINT